jgi:hypothetical protein
MMAGHVVAIFKSNMEDFNDFETVYEMLINVNIKNEEREHLQ